MDNNSCDYPKGDDQILLFWSYMLKALRNMGPRKLELFEMEGVIALALELDEIDRWTMNATFDEFPRLAAHLPLVDLPVNQIMYLHRRLMIALHPDDKAKLEAKNDIVIKTSNSNYVISWKKNEKGKKDGESGKKEEKKVTTVKGDDDKTEEEAKEQKVADTKNTKDTKEPKMDDEASDGKNKVEGDNDKTVEKEEVKKEKMTGEEGKKEKDNKGSKSEYGELDGKRSAEREEVAEEEEEVAEEGVIEKMTGDDVKKKKKNEKKKVAKGKADEMKRGRFTKDEEDRMMCYVVETIKKNSSYGLKSKKMSTGDAWSEFSTREEKRNPEKKKTPGSYESHFQKEYQIQIEFKDEQIVGWKFQGTSIN